MTELLAATTITAPVTAQIGPTVKFNRRPDTLNIQGNFIFGSGGATATLYVQTTLDGGRTWTDIAKFAFTTSSARSIFNLSSRTPVIAAAAATDGTLAGAALDGVLGPWFRTKLTTTSTYAGGTTIAADINGDQV
jgi:hypothetical protein